MAAVSKPFDDEAGDILIRQKAHQLARTVSCCM
jgi:hypothetical protein